jgi:hypothetical protein
VPPTAHDHGADCWQSLLQRPCPMSAQRSWPTGALCDRASFRERVPVSTMIYWSRATNAARAMRLWGVHESVFSWCSSRSAGTRLGGHRIETLAVHPPVGPTTPRSRVVSRASTRVMYRRMVVGCRASLDLPAPGGPKITRDELLCWMKVQSTFLKTGRV